MCQTEFIFHICGVEICMPAFSKRLAENVASEVTYNVLSGSLNPAAPFACPRLS